MLYSVIYTVDVPSNESIVPFLPPHRRKLWETTEGDGGYDCEDLGGVWAKGKHRKLVALLTQEEFDKFIDHVGLYAENVETMGSLGAPGFGMGWAPAIAFIGNDPNAILDAYVTPLLGHVEDGKIVSDEDVELPLDDKAWDNIRDAIIERYG